MIVGPLIERKRDGAALSPEEWSALVAEYTSGHIPDYQIAALLMAVFLRGLERQELAALTDAMLASGDRLSFDGLKTPVIDKHSTGGVGDKVSLVLAPLVAACGVAVPMMSGRGLGHTGGTLDKLEAIPGFRTNLSLAETRAQVQRLDCALIGQTAEIAPADYVGYGEDWNKLIGRTIAIKPSGQYHREDIESKITLPGKDPIAVAEGKFAIVHLRLRNVSGQTRKAPWSFVIDQDGNLSIPDPQAMAALWINGGPDARFFIFEPIPPGGTFEGDVVFDVERSARRLQIGVPDDFIFENYAMVRL